MFQLVDAEKAHHPVQVLCNALEVSRSGFYAWKKRPPAARAASDEQLAVEIAATHAKSIRRYGSPRIHRALRRKGIRVSRKRVARVTFKGPLLATGTPVTANGQAIGAIGSSYFGHALAMLRLDKAREALAAGYAIMAGSVPLTLVDTPQEADGAGR